MPAKHSTRPIYVKYSVIILFPQLDHCPCGVRIKTFDVVCNTRNIMSGRHSRRASFSRRGKNPPRLFTVTKRRLLTKYSAPWILVSILYLLKGIAADTNIFLFFVLLVVMSKPSKFYQIQVKNF